MLAYVLLLSAFVLAISRAEIIDRIAVILDSQVITESEILRELRLTAFLNGDTLNFSPDARRKAAERLIEQKLIRKEMEMGRYAQPIPAETVPMVKQIETQRFPGSEEYRHALERYGVTEDDLKAHLLWQMALLRFIEVRFRPGVQVTEDEIREYFSKELPALQKNAGPSQKLSFDDLRDKIQELLTSQRVEKQLDDWLAETRKRMRVEFRREAFQ
jgi:peptidyl-prolyl cis-trans isomerase SurA